VAASVASSAAAPPDRGGAPARRAVARAASSLLVGFADPLERGLLVWGRETRPLTLRGLDPASAEGVAAYGLVRLAHLAERVADEVAAHPRADVRRAAAGLGARAHVLIAGLQAPGER
jgi:hypothetical protein